MRRDARVAFYYAPPPDDSLHAAASAWLGRDAVTNAPLPQPDLPDIAAITAEPRLYGFHATLKPPMHLAEGVTWSDVLDTTRQIAASVPAFDLPPLAVTDLGGFLALCEANPSVPLQSFSDACVAGADHLRAPVPQADLARRRKGGALPPAQEANLVRWGYHYVFATWKFHMTLTRRLTPAEKAVFMPAARAHFADILAMPRRVSDLALFTQAAPGAGFTIAARFPLQA
jgi:hypothetical protein